MPTKAQPAAAANDLAVQSELVAVTDAKMNISVERTISVKQYEPIKVFGSLSFSQNTSAEEIEGLLGRFNEYGERIATQVFTFAEEQATALRGSAEAPRARAAAAPRAAARASAAPRAGEESVSIQGRELIAYTNNEGTEAFKTGCEICGQTAYFNAYSNRRTGAVVSAEQSVQNALKFDKGLFCRDHKPPKGGAAASSVVRRAAPRVETPPPVDDDDLPF